MMEANREDAEENEMYLFYTILRDLNLTTKQLLNMPNSRYMAYRKMLEKRIKLENEAMPGKGSSGFVKTMGGGVNG